MEAQLRVGSSVWLAAQPPAHSARGRVFRVGFASPPRALACLVFRNFYAASLRLEQRDADGATRVLLDEFPLMRHVHCEDDAQDWHVVHLDKLNVKPDVTRIESLTFYLFQPSPLFETWELQHLKIYESRATDGDVEADGVLSLPAQANKHEHAEPPTTMHQLMRRLSRSSLLVVDARDVREHAAQVLSRVHHLRQLVHRVASSSQLRDLFAALEIYLRLHELSDERRRCVVGRRRDHAVVPQLVERARHPLVLPRLLVGLRRRELAARAFAPREHASGLRHRDVVRGAAHERAHLVAGQRRHGRRAVHVAVRRVGQRLVAVQQRPARRIAEPEPPVLAVAPRVDRAARPDLHADVREQLAVRAAVGVALGERHGAVREREPAGRSQRLAVAVRDHGHESVGAGLAARVQKDRRAPGLAVAFDRLRVLDQHDARGAVAQGALDPRGRRVHALEAARHPRRRHRRRVVPALGLVKGLRRHEALEQLAHREPVRLGRPRRLRRHRDHDHRHVDAGVRRQRELERVGARQVEHEQHGERAGLLRREHAPRHGLDDELAPRERRLPVGLALADHDDREAVGFEEVGRQALAHAARQGREPLAHGRVEHVRRPARARRRAARRAAGDDRELGHRRQLGGVRRLELGVSLRVVSRQQDLQVDARGLAARHGHEPVEHVAVEPEHEHLLELERSREAAEAANDVRQLGVVRGHERRLAQAERCDALAPERAALVGLALVLVLVLFDVVDVAVSEDADPVFADVARLHGVLRAAPRRRAGQEGTQPVDAAGEREPDAGAFGERVVIADAELAQPQRRDAGLLHGRERVLAVVAAALAPVAPLEDAAVGRERDRVVLPARDHHDALLAERQHGLGLRQEREGRVEHVPVHERDLEARVRVAVAQLALRGLAPREHVAVAAQRQAVVVAADHVLHGDRRGLLRRRALEVHERRGLRQVLVLARVALVDVRRVLALAQRARLQRRGRAMAQLPVVVEAPRMDVAVIRDHERVAEPARDLRHERRRREPEREPRGLVLRERDLVGGCVFVHARQAAAPAEERRAVARQRERAASRQRHGADLDVEQLERLHEPQRRRRRQGRRVGAREARALASHQHAAVARVGLGLGVLLEHLGELPLAQKVLQQRGRRVALALLRRALALEQSARAATAPRRLDQHCCTFSASRRSPFRAHILGEQRLVLLPLASERRAVVTRQDEPVARRPREPERERIAHLLAAEERDEALARRRRVDVATHFARRHRDFRGEQNVLAAAFSLASRQSEAGAVGGELSRERRHVERVASPEPLDADRELARALHDTEEELREIGLFEDRLFGARGVGRVLEERQQHAALVRDAPDRVRAQHHGREELHREHFGSAARKRREKVFHVEIQHEQRRALRQSLGLQNVLLQQARRRQDVVGHDRKPRRMQHAGGVGVVREPRAELVDREEPRARAPQQSLVKHVGVLLREPEQQRETLRPHGHVGRAVLEPDGHVLPGDASGATRSRLDARVLGAHGVVFFVLELLAGRVSSRSRSQITKLSETMARRGSGEVVPAATGKSRAEIAALRHLREAYDALSLRGDGAAERSPQKRPLSSRGRVVDTVRSLQSGQSASASPTRSRDVFAQWLTLEALASAIQTDVTALQREVQSCEARVTAAIRLPADGFDNLDPKLLVLSEVLGREVFAQYAADLFHELAALRRRWSLYGDTLKQFREQVEIGCIGSHCIRDVVSHGEWLEIANATVAALKIQSPGPLLVSHFPVLMQHSSLPRTTREGENAVLVPEILTLLERVPPARERLLALCFEQITDVRRGAGYSPPPEGVRPHKLTALTKQSHADALCTTEELDQILSWLDDDDSDDGFVTTNEFRSFHIPMSDTYIDEDAEFVAFLMRVWRFQVPPDLFVGDVVADYEARCQEATNKTRKTEVIKKLDHLSMALPPKLASLRSLLGQRSALSVASASHLDVLATNHQLTAGTLNGLRTLHLNGLGLREFPIFVVALPVLEELELSENQLRDPLPLAAVGGLKTLKSLVLRDNFLSDRSVTMAGEPEMTVWAGLEALVSLNLAHNQLTAIPSVFIQLKNLKSLELASNKLRDSGISIEAAKKWRVQGYPQLQVVDLRGNELSALPDVLVTTGRETLEVLFVQDNQLTELPTQLLSLERLHEADFTHNRLKPSQEMDLTPLVARCADLTVFALGHNTLKHFPFVNPASGVAVQRPQVVSMAKNRLRVLPSLRNVSFAGCRELDLRGNAITEISDDFFVAFPHLQACSLQQNAIKRLPDSISSCKQLQTLELYENKLEFVPASLATLRELAVLNLRENQLTKIPTEWHEFSSYRDEGHHLRPRRLHTLYLQRNPLRNKVLQALVDGVGGAAATFKSNATQICEMYTRKLIDTLKQSVPVQKLAKAVHVDASDDEEREQDDSQRPRRQWKGRARFALLHVESLLKAKCEPTDDGRARLLVSSTVFTKLLRQWMVASTKKELQLTADRFETTAKGLVNGLAFLASVEAVGLFNALPPEMDARVTSTRSESVRKPADAVASILQYLQVAHEQRMRPPEPDPSDKARLLAPPQAPDQKAPASPPKHRQSAKTVREPAAKAASKEPRQENPDVARYRTKLDRERQRVRVLEQQLMDERLLRLGAARPAETAAVPQEQQPAHPAASVLVHVKQLNRDMTATPEAGERVVIAVAAQATVRQLKDAIARRLGVDVTRQILIAKHATRPRDHVRLRDDATIASYGCRSTNWTVSLLISELVRVVWVKEHAAITQQAGSTGNEVRSDEAPSQPDGRDASPRGSRQCERVEDP